VQTQQAQLALQAQLGQQSLSSQAVGSNINVTA
jgi:hypothetical protein